MANGRGVDDRAITLNELADALHELCQPLTALHCRLEIGRMSDEAALQTAEWKRHGMKRLFAECLQECTRLSATVVAMRATVQRALADEQGRD